MLRPSLIVLVVALLFPSVAAAEPPPDAERIVVSSVTDGDTVTIQLTDGRSERLRLIGIDAPESVDPFRPVMCYSSEASARVRELADGREALLEMDVEARDRFGRLLGYLWLQDDDGTMWMLNERLAADGYAVQLTIQPNSRYADRFAAAVASARDQGLGLWIACAEPAVANVEPSEPVQSIAAPVPTATSVPARSVVPNPPSTSGSGRFAPSSGGTACPGEAPIKGNRNSMIYHMPGQQAYERTKPEDCFATESAAQAAGYRRAQR